MQGYPGRMSAEQSPRPAVLFDIDGTLVDSNYLHAFTWTRAFHEVGRPVDTWRIHRCIGMDGSLIVDTLLDGPDDDLATRAKDLHSRYYKDTASLLRTFAQARELVDRVADLGLQAVLATSAPEDELAMLREVLGVEDVVSTVTSSEDVDTAKPKPDIVAVALERAGVPAERAVFVGDTVWDAQACQRAGVTFIGVCSGGISRDELHQAGAKETFADPADLLDRIDDSAIAALLE